MNKFKKIEQEEHMNSEMTGSITDTVLGKQDSNGCWNVLKNGDKYYPDLNYYVPKYKSTIWTLVLLADIQADHKKDCFKKPISAITDYLFDKKVNIYSLGKSHFPIPCLNGNMLYLLSYFHFPAQPVINSIVDFFAEYQRFDDGDFKTPSSFPYCSNRSCYGKHTCYWGIIKLFKGLSHIPPGERSKNAQKLIGKCIDFILLHDVCFSSRDKSNFIHPGIKELTFPNMYHADFLEILWLLKREKVQSIHLNKALALLKSKMKTDQCWEIERPVKNMVIRIDTNHNYGKELISRRAREVLDYYLNENEA